MPSGVNDSRRSTSSDSPTARGSSTPPTRFHHFKVVMWTTIIPGDLGHIRGSANAEDQFYWAIKQFRQ
jgi:hypothetical protein